MQVTKYAPPSTQGEKKRNSSIEIYRIVATFAVLIVHFNGWFVGGVPEKFDFSNPTFFRISQMVISAATVICVNMFILISGYFGIKLKLKSIIRLCLLLLFIYVPFYLVRSVLTHDFVIETFISKFFVISNAGYFIQCYFMLMILSPILNTFVEKYGRDVLKWVVVFFILEFWFSCIMGIDAFGYNHGYSIIHFVLIYLIARCIKLYEPDLLKIKRGVWVLGYIMCTAIICLMYVCGIDFSWDYSNPVVIVSSICTFLPFLYMSYYNKAINWIAGGTLAVYIIQVTNPVHHLLQMIDSYLLNSFVYPLYLLLGFIVIIITFSGAVMYGKICDVVIKPIIRRIERKINISLDY